MSGREFFKEIFIGGVRKEQLINELIEAGIRFNKYADILFDHPSFSPGDKAEKVQLIKVKLSDLHLGNPCPFQEIISKGINLGLRLCPLYLGAFLRLKYLDQPQGPYLTIVSAKPENDENYPNGFYIRNFENALWLRGYRTTGNCEWPINNEFIFLK